MNPDGFLLRQRGNANNIDLNRDFPDQVFYFWDWFLMWTLLLSSIHWERRFWESFFFSSNLVVLLYSKEFTFWIWRMHWIHWNVVGDKIQKSYTRMSMLSKDFLFSTRHHKANIYFTCKHRNLEEIEIPTGFLKLLHFSLSGFAYWLLTSDTGKV